MADGSKELIARLDGLANITPKARQVVRQNADVIKNLTQVNAPYKTGNLHDGVNVKMTGNAHQSKAVISANAYNKGFNYGLYQERYNRRGRAKFMERAFNMVEPKFKKEMEALLRK